MITSKKISVLAIDLAKEVFQLHGVDKNGNVVFKKKVTRAKLYETVTNIPPCTIAMEACGGAHYWAREFKKAGHDPKIISAQFVKPFLKGNKTDGNDAAAISEAAQRPTMRFVSIKPVHNQDIQMVHRARQRLIKNRTALSNEIRGFFLEYGIAIPKTISKLKKILLPILDDPEEKRLTSMSVEIFRTLLEELGAINAEVEKYDDQIKVILSTNEFAQRITAIEGVGPITATAIVAAIGDFKSFKSGREFSAYLGLVPKQFSSGGKTNMQGISKRGDQYLRSLLIHGGRAAVRVASGKEDARSIWAIKKVESRGFNKACVAFANKNARIIWALLAKNQFYRPSSLKTGNN